VFVKSSLRVHHNKKRLKSTVLTNLAKGSTTGITFPGTSLCPGTQENNFITQCSKIEAETNMLLANAMLFPVTSTHGQQNTQTVCYNYGFKTLKIKKAVKVKENDIQF